jgi:signal transduction histidine kinase
VCRQIIEQHHGRIRVESVVGKGSTFTVKLPRRLAEDPE